MTEQSARAVSPFVDTDSVPFAREAPAPWLTRAETPFLQEYDATGEDEAEDLASAALGELFAELYDEEFEVATAELADELHELVPGAFAGELGEPRDAARFESVLREALEPVARAAEAYLSEVEARTRGVDDGELTGDRVLALMNEVEPVLAAESPAFEQFLGGLVKKFKKVAKGAVSLAKKGVALAASPLLAPVLKKLKSLVRPLLDRVLKFALNKVPVAYRPLAQTLLDKLQGKVASAVARATAADSARVQRTAAAAPPATAPALPAATSLPADDAAALAPLGGLDATASPDAASADVGDVQQGIDQELLEVVLGREDEFMQEAPEARAKTYQDHPSAELARARARFVAELEEHLARGESPGPAIENFVPAVLMAVRAGVKLIGRPKVVSFLGGLIARLIAPLIGKQAAPMLGNMLADIGLRTFVQAEIDEGGRRAAVGHALASTVEETARRLAELSDTVLDTPELLEVSALEAFETAAAANFPPELIRPELREWEGPGTWVSLPLRGPRLFKKFSHVFDVTIAPHTAHGIVTFGGGSLASFFRDCLRLSPQAQVHARVHLYEAIPGTRLGHIARHERLRSLSSGAHEKRAFFHPLHPRAAQALLQAARLGRETVEQEDPLRPTIGQRFYYLEVPNAPARSMGGASHLHATVNLRQGEIYACVYLSEALAQKSSALLRSGKPPAAVVRELRAALAPNVASLANGRAGTRLRILGAKGMHARRSGLAARIDAALLGSLREPTARAATDWLWLGLSDYLRTSGDAFIKASEGPEDGVRICARFHDVPGLRELKSVLMGGRAATLVTWPPKSAPRMTVTVHAGPKHD